ncbi:high-affinity zinc uptake system binding-protein ZnuA precursor [Oxobacter pfennigii]|uniref:High-affinity zinc uptake system binding-protein ZnuA n=1 Tax=Oxobacter pfennigii TaxID=36849 RepID=A0A0P8WBX6_9CLOT|nr:metal ABC transporter substrate-binding protein [Oxobacter pfennigii]KPU45415.1 high-affinity zinc uptake system binding-protein ZnuA precursor [Oxobacter pfennigii]
MKSKIKSVVSIMMTILLLVASGCSSTKDAGQNKDNEQPSLDAQQKKLIVYTSIYPMYDFAQNIGKDKIDLRQMIPAGTEPHDWEPTAKIMADIEKADVLIYNGAGMEPWAEKLVESINNKDLIIVDTSKGIELLTNAEDEHEEEEEEDAHGEYDPHLWLDPLTAIKQSENIKNAFVEADADNKDFYEGNYNEFTDKLNALDSKYKEELVNLKHKEFVVAHAAFGYLAQRYNLEQISLRGINSQDEPSSKEMKEITEILKSKEIKYVFFETLTSPKLSQALAGEVGAKTEVLNPMDGLTDEDIKSGKNYLSIMEDNLSVLKKALGE